MALKRFEYSQNGTKNPPERDGANELCWKARGYKVILGKANFSSSTTGRILITCFFWVFFRSTQQAHCAVVPFALLKVDSAVIRKVER